MAEERGGSPPLLVRTADGLDRDRAARRDQGQDQGHGRSGGRVGGDRRGDGATPAPVITLPAGTRVWLATGHTDMRKGLTGLALQVQEVLRRDPYGGHLFVFRGRRGDLIKILWHDTQGMCLFGKRLERGRFIWPSPAEGVVTITSGAARLFAGRDRLADAAADLAAGTGRVSRELRLFDSAVLADTDKLSALCLTSGCAELRRLARRPRRGARDDPGRARRTARGRGGGLRRPAGDRAPEAAARQGAARAVRPVLRARGQARSTSSSCSWPSSRRRAAEDEAAAEIAAPAGAGSTARARPAQAGPPAAARAPAARADRLPRTLHLPQVRRPGPQARRGRHRDPRVRAAALEGGRARAREGHLPRAARRSASRRRPRTRSPAAEPGRSLLALVLAAKYGQHLPLTRQSAIYAREGVEIDVSTLADWVGAAAASLMPLVAGDPGARVRGRAAARRRHHRAGAGQGADQDRALVGLCPRRPAVRRARPAGGGVLLLARPRAASIPSGTWPASPGILQADAYAGFNRLYEPEPRSRGRSSRPPAGPMPAASCSSWPRSAKAPIAAEAVRRIDELFAIERDINGKPAEARLAVRAERLGADPGRARGLAARTSTSGSRASRRSARRSPTRLNHWTALTRFLERRADLPEQQRGRAGAARRGRRAAQLDLRRLGPWRRAGGRDLHPDRDRQAQRHRSPGLARRRPRPAARSSGQAHRPAPALAVDQLGQDQRSSLSHQLSAASARPFTGCVRTTRG